MAIRKGGVSTWSANSCRIFCQVDLVNSIFIFKPPELCTLRQLSNHPDPSDSNNPKSRSRKGTLSSPTKAGGE